jgi:hypothetical protein
MKRVIPTLLILLASAEIGQAATISFSTVVNIASCPNSGPGQCSLITSMPTQTIAVGDFVDFTVNFAAGQRLVMFDDNGGTETFFGWLDAVGASSTFTISGASITPLNLLGTLTAPLAVATQSSGTAHIGPGISADFIATGSSISFTGYHVQFTVTALAVNPNTYSANFLVVGADRLQVVADAAVPEPASLLLAGSGLAVLVMRRRPRARMRARRP